MMMPVYICSSTAIMTMCAVKEQNISSSETSSKLMNDETDV